jgi:hypothetical protein
MRAATSTARSRPLSLEKEEAMQLVRTPVTASLVALIVGASGAAEAQQPASDVPPPAKATTPHRSKHKPAMRKPTAQEEMAAQIQALRDQVDALQRRLDAQNAAQQQAQTTASQAAAQAAAATAQASAATVAAAAIPADVRAAVEAAKPKTDKIYYKGVTLTLGGFGAAEFIYRSKNEAADLASSFSAIPLANNTVGHTSEFVASARQSRFTGLAEGDPTPEVHLGFYGEFDFLGAAQTANSNETNSYTPRIRVLYNQIDWANEGLHFLAGQNWSLVTLQGHGITPRAEVIPPTIDAQYIPGFSFTRQPQIRITKDFDKTFWLGLSIENPATTFYAGANAFPTGVTVLDGAAATATSTAGTASLSGYNSANTLSLNHIPDVVLKAAYDQPIADRTIHLEVFGLYRSFYERLDYHNRDVNGGGIGAGLTMPIVARILDLQVSGMGGKGIGRYGAGQLTDVTFDAAGVIHPISEIQALAGLTLHPVSGLDIYLFAGEEKESAQPYYLTTSSGSVVGYGYGNPLYINSGCQSETATTTCTANNRVVEQATGGFWYRPWVGAAGKYQFGIQYSYTERKTFPGAEGIAPKANDSMVFTSFRYYPFF